VQQGTALVTNEDNAIPPSPDNFLVPHKVAETRRTKDLRRWHPSHLGDRKGRK